MIKQSDILNEKTKNRLNSDKNIFSEILKNMGKNVILDLFMKDQVDNFSKASFRRFIEVKVKNYLRKDFLDFECVSHIHLFEKMKKSLFINPLLNKNTKNQSYRKPNCFFRNRFKRIEIIKDHTDKHFEYDTLELCEENKILSTNKNIKNDINEKSDLFQNKFQTSNLNNENNINTCEINNQSMTSQNDILNIIDHKNNLRSEEQEKREKIFFLVQSYVIILFNLK